MIACTQQQLTFSSISSSRSAQRFTCGCLLNPEILEGRSSYACFAEEKAQSGGQQLTLEEMGSEPLARAKSLSDLNKLPKGTGV